jgi:peroxiredoxin
VSSSDTYAFSPNPPVPVDDGACVHLSGAAVPPVRLRSSNGRVVDVSTVVGTAVLYICPRIAAPDHPSAAWNALPGAQGCTPQSCRYRDLYPAFSTRGIQLFGISTQSPALHRETAERLTLPFELLSDWQLELTHGWALPTFTVEGEVMLHRLTLIIRDGVVRKVFYPVFPPATDADAVLEWLSAE